jgi:hypothetical protein
VHQNIRNQTHEPLWSAPITAILAHLPLFNGILEAERSLQLIW